MFIIADIDEASPSEDEEAALCAFQAPASEARYLGPKDFVFIFNKSLH